MRVPEPEATKPVCGKPGHRHCGLAPELSSDRAAEELQLPPNTWGCTDKYEDPKASLPDPHCNVRDCTLYVDRQVSVPYSTNWGGACQDLASGEPGTCVDGFCATPANKPAACGAHALVYAATAWVRVVRSRQEDCSATGSPADCNMGSHPYNARGLLIAWMASCMEGRAKAGSPEPLLPWGDWPIELPPVRER